MWWIIGSVALLAVASFVFYGQRIGAGSKHDVARDRQTNYALIESYSHKAANRFGQGL